MVQIRRLIIRLTAVFKLILTGIGAILDDLLFLAGAWLVVYGLGLVDRVWAFLGAGAFCLVAAVLVGVGRAKK